jgi:hypothetical protein
MKKVLMVAYHYPPEGSSSGVLRTLKFSKYLPRHQWAPSVLTVKSWLYPIRDMDLMADIPPNVAVHRTWALDSVRHLGIRGRHLACLAIPDRFVTWLPFGIACGLRVIRQEGIQALCSTSPVPTAHLIAAVLKRVTGLPWLADFRDPWIEEGLHPRPGTLRYRTESTLERLVVTSADRVVVTTPRMKADFLARYPTLSPARVDVIYNGYDEADFPIGGDVPQGTRFEIIHAGLVTPDYRNPLPVLRTMAQLIAEGLIPAEKVRITFLGDSPYLSSNDFLSSVHSLGLRHVVHIAPHVAHRDALRLMREASVLLLLQASEDTRALIPAKSFEYLRLGRPILALTLAGATADLLRGMSHCYAVTPSDEAGIRNALTQLYRLWAQSPVAITLTRSIQRFERAALAGELAGILDEVCGAAHRSPAQSRERGDVAANRS